MEIPTAGRIVQYVLPAQSGYPGESRPAMVTGVFGDLCNLSVFCDQYEDMDKEKPLKESEMVVRQTSRAGDEDKSPGTWHWPERTS